MGLAVGLPAAYSCAMSDESQTAAPPSPAAHPPRLEALHLLVTYRCTYACDHCFVWGSPDQESTMTLAQLREAIDQAASAGCTTVYFEGGEPMLAYPVVLAAARHARANGLEVGIVSNCFWAETFDDALVWLTPFAELGLADLALSSYAYFTERLEDETRLRNALLAARDLGLPGAVLEVGAAAALADIGVPCGEPGQIMYKGRAAQALATGERL
ncbi:MAG TPA: radical SAM protein, partial [Thermoleophilia bacterium]|nr:radical SAM protein [Thermoleophilia bacterium]